MYRRRPRRRLCEAGEARACAASAARPNSAERSEAEKIPSRASDWAGSSPRGSAGCTDGALPGNANDWAGSSPRGSAGCTDGVLAVGYAKRAKPAPAPRQRRHRFPPSDARRPFVPLCVFCGQKKTCRHPADRPFAVSQYQATRHQSPPSPATQFCRTSANSLPDRQRYGCVHVPIVQPFQVIFAQLST